MKNFEELLSAVAFRRRTGANALLTDTTYDSRAVVPGTLFVAMRGESSDGNRYVEQAIARGAAAIVTDTASSYDELVKAHPGLPLAEVLHGRKALAELSRAFYEFPDHQMKVSGVTGTNGKTTTTFLLEQMLRAVGRGTVLVGTIEYRILDRVLPSPHTTPESADLFKLLAEGVSAGATEAVMEVSSHALEQGRVWQLAVDTAIFTNLTQDHLDYHGDFESYFRAKQALFDGTCSRAPRHSIINADDEWGTRLAGIARSAGSELRTYGIHDGDFRATGVRMSASGTHFTMQTPTGTAAMTSRLVGRVNVYNVLAAAAGAAARGLTLEQIAAAAEDLQAPPGRFEAIDCGQDFAVIVDYAHTPDAVRNVTAMARELVQESRGRVITVFGCGGDRDRSKRPLMGEAAGEGSDVVIVTSDNPRSEKPEAIIAEILPGVKRTLVKVEVEPDRAQAIAAAVAQARPGDLVLIAGKGHERTQTIGKQVLPFDDAEEARSVLGRATGKAVL